MSWSPGRSEPRRSRAIRDARGLRSHQQPLQGESRRRRPDVEVHGQWTARTRPKCRLRGLPGRPGRFRRAGGLVRGTLCIFIDGKALNG